MTQTQTADQYKDAYIYGYALVDNYRVFYEDQNTQDAQGNLKTMNQLYGEARTYGPDDTLVVTPNNDTPYSLGYLDLRGGWCSLYIPDSAEIADRYNSFQCVDMFTNNIGYISVKDTPISSKKKTGRYCFYNTETTDLSEIAIDDFDKVWGVRSKFLFLIGRTQMFPDAVSQELEEAMVQKVMDSFQIQAQVPTEGFPSDAVAVGTKPMADWTAREFFDALAYALTLQTPAPGSYDENYRAELASLGIVPGQAFSGSELAAEEGCKSGRDFIDAESTRIGDSVDGWDLMDTHQSYFDANTKEDTVFRSLVAKKGIYANNPNEAYYPIANLDENGDRLNGNNRYQLTISDPPVEAFWSLTLYRMLDGFLVDNPFQRYSVGTGRVDDSENGMITIDIRPVTAEENPELERNVLPSPPGEEFYVVLRLYLPEQVVLDKLWMPAGLQKV